MRVEEHDYNKQPQLHITLYLAQDTAQPKVTGVSVQDVLTGLCRKSQNRCMYKLVAQGIKSCQADWIPNKWNIFFVNATMGVAILAKFGINRR